MRSCEQWTHFTSPKIHHMYANCKFQPKWVPTHIATWDRTLQLESFGHLSASHPLAPSLECILTVVIFINCSKKVNTSHTPVAFASINIIWVSWVSQFYVNKENIMSLWFLKIPQWVALYSAYYAESYIYRLRSWSYSILMKTEARRALAI